MFLHLSGLYEEQELYTNHSFSIRLSELRPMNCLEHYVLLYPRNASLQVSLYKTKDAYK